ncbi:MAG: carbon-nitrogen hydrolase family protein [Myxococcota bacterium]
MTRIAVTQMTSNDEVDKNLAAVERNLRRSAEGGAALAVVPECFAYMAREGEYVSIAESLDEGGPILERCRTMAKTFRLEVIYGGFWEKGADGRVRNTSLHMRADGSIAAAYQKIHLFDVDLPDGTKLCESAIVEGGEQAVVTESAAGRIGMTICYDVRFGALYDALALAGAQILTVPAAFTLMTGKDHWEVLLRARAIEQQCYVAAAAQVGHHRYADGTGERHSWGHAMIVDPWGVVIAQCGAGEGVALAEIDLPALASIRRQLPALRHRVPFAPPADPE